MENAREINSPPSSPQNNSNQRVMQQAARAFALERAIYETTARRQRGPRTMEHPAVNPANRTPAQRFEEWSRQEQTYHRDWINDQFENSLNDLGPLARGYNFNLWLERRLLREGLPGDVGAQLQASRQALLHEAAQEARRGVMTLQRMIRNRAQHNRRYITRDNAAGDLQGSYSEAQAQVEAAAIILMALIEDL
ncbi:hypothetical protein [Sweet potato pakakuy virus]|uniref:Uncharacterized protein n=1 Tax=Sweet potato pakakuy virus TaxID=2034762 RepID=C4NFM6_9VIRU|nr:hypothetical protein [Sweet potato pakakuy virus]ACN56747.1 hypothetical protein [Sweet potato pakakuy virus]